LATIARAAGDEAQHVQTGLHGETIDCPGEAAFGERSNHHRRRRSGVEVNRHVQCVGCFEDVPELPIVEIFAGGVRVDNRAF
jgi:hypothetical protein